jgi:hypothetical protein
VSNTTEFKIKLNGIDVIVKDLKEATSIIDVLKAKLVASNGKPAVQKELEAALVVYKQIEKAAAVTSEVQRRASAEAAKAIGAEVDAMEKAAADAERIAAGAKPILTVKINGVDTALFTVGEVEKAVETLKEEFKSVPDATSAAFKAVQAETLKATSKLEEMEQSIEFLTPEKKIAAFTALTGTITAGFSLGTLAASKFSDTLGISEESTKKLDDAINTLNTAQQAYQTILLATSGEQLKDIKNTARQISLALSQATANATVAGSYSLAAIQARLFGTAAKTAWTATGIGLFIVAMVTVYQYWDTIKQGAEKMGTGVKAVFSTLVDFMRNYYSVVTFGLVDDAKTHAINAAKEEAAEKGKIASKSLEDNKDIREREIALLNTSEAEKKRLIAVGNKETFDNYKSYYDKQVAELKKKYDLSDAQDLKNYTKKLAEDKKKYTELELTFKESNKAFLDEQKKAAQEALDIDYNQRKKQIELAASSDVTKAKQLLNLQKTYAIASNKALDEKNDTEYKSILKNNEDVVAANKAFADAKKKSAQDEVAFSLEHGKRMIELSSDSELVKAKKLLDLQRKYTVDANKLLKASNDVEKRTIVKNNEDLLAAEKAYQDAKKVLVENEVKRNKLDNELAKAKLDAENNLHDSLLSIELDYQNSLGDIKLRQLNKEKVYQSEIDKLNIDTENKKVATQQKFNEITEQKEREHTAALQVLADEKSDYVISKLQKQIVEDDVIEKQHFSKRIAAIKANAALERAIAKEEASKAYSGVDTKHDNDLTNLKTRYDAEIKLAGDNAVKLAEIDKKYAVESKAINENYADAKLKVAEDLSKKEEDIRKKDTQAEKDAADKRKEYLLQKVQQVAEIANGILDIMSTAISNKLDRMIADIDAKVDTTNTAIDGLKDAIADSADNVNNLEEKLSKARGNQRDKIIKDIEKERQKNKQLNEEKLKQEQKLVDFNTEKEALEMEASEKKKKIAQTQALINIAQGITLAFATNPFPINLIDAAIVAASGAVQLAAINQAKFALGGKVDGPSHAQGGVQMFHKNGSHLGEMEGGEFITRKAATARNIEALDTINRMGANTTFTVVPQKFAMGGVVGDYAGVEQDVRESKVDTTNIALQYLMQQQANTNAELIALHNKPIVVDARQVVSEADKANNIKIQATKNF